MLGIEETPGNVAVVSTSVCAVCAVGNDLSQSHARHLNHTCSYINKVYVCSLLSWQYLNQSHLHNILGILVTCGPHTVTSAVFLCAACTVDMTLSHSYLFEHYIFMKCNVWDVSLLKLSLLIT